MYNTNDKGNLCLEVAQMIRERQQQDVELLSRYQPVNQNSQALTTFFARDPIPRDQLSLEVAQMIRERQQQDVEFIKHYG